MTKIPALSPTGLAIGFVLIGGNLAAALASGAAHLAAVIAMTWVNAAAYLIVVGSFLAVRKATREAAVYRALAASSVPEVAGIEDAFRRLLQGDE